MSDPEDFGALLAREAARPVREMGQVLKGVIQLTARPRRELSFPFSARSTRLQYKRIGLSDVATGFRCKDPGRMPEVLGEEETGLTVIGRLNELLEAGRAGVDSLSRLCPEARGPEMQKLFEEARNDEAWSCAGVVRSIKTMGGTASAKKGGFAEKVVQRLDGLLGETLPSSPRGFSKR